MKWSAINLFLFTLRLLLFEGTSTCASLPFYFCRVTKNSIHTHVIYRAFSILNTQSRHTHTIRLIHIWIWQTEIGFFPLENAVDVFLLHLAGFFYHVFFISRDFAFCVSFVSHILLLSCVNQMCFWIYFNAHYSFMGINCC